MTSSPPLAEPTCLGRTCLRWTPDGELDREDWHHLLVRLAAVEGQQSPPHRWEPLQRRERPPCAERPLQGEPPEP